MPEGIPSPQSSIEGSNLHGSARWMNAADADAINLQDPKGVVLGCKTNGERIYFNGEGDILVFAPKGAGKGIGFVQPNLHDYQGSMVVLDPKGENAIVSARHRCERGQKVLILDPFGKTTSITGISSDTYNPLSALTYASPEDLGPGIEALADALIITPPNERDPHWSEGGKKFLAFLMWFMVAHLPPAERNLIKLYELAHGGRDLFERIGTVMSEGRSKDPDVARVCRAQGNWFLGRPEREFGYFESVATIHLGWLGDFVWSSVLAGPPSPPLPLKTQKITVYLVLPFNRLERYQRWLRLMIADCLSTLYATHGAPDPPVLFMLDEAFAGLGKMDILLTATAAARSAGARLCMVYQDLEQVNKLYGDAWGSFIANSGATLFFAVNDMKAAEFISKRCGQRTASVPGIAQGVPELLMRVEQVYQMPKDEVLGLFRSSPPARFGRLNVRTDNRYQGLAENETYGEPEEKAYVARTDYEPVDLSSVKPKRARQGEDTNAFRDTNNSAVPTDEMNADEKEAALLEYLSQFYEGRRIFKHANGRYGYQDSQGMFVPVDAR